MHVKEVQTHCFISQLILVMEQLPGLLLFGSPVSAIRKIIVMAYYDWLYFWMDNIPTFLHLSSCFSWVCRPELTSMNIILLIPFSIKFEKLSDTQYVKNCCLRLIYQLLNKYFLCWNITFLLYNMVFWSCQ